MENIFDEKIYSLIKALICVLFLAITSIFFTKKIRIFLSRQKKIYSPPCLVLLENFMIDSKRRLIRIQNSEQEHLILLSPTGDVVISTSKTIIKNSMTENNKI